MAIGKAEVVGRPPPELSISPTDKIDGHGGANMKKKKKKSLIVDFFLAICF
jgi:hypothetical protein